MEVKNLSDRLSAVENVKKQYSNGIKRGHKPVFRTCITRLAYNEFGECIAEDEFHNETVLGGALTVLEKLWGITAPLKIASINKLLVSMILFHWRILLQQMKILFASGVLVSVVVVMLLQQ